jgi:hypothetical protein
MRRTAGTEDLAQVAVSANRVAAVNRRSRLENLQNVRNRDPLLILVKTRRDDTGRLETGLG